MSSATSGVSQRAEESVAVPLLVSVSGVGVVSRSSPTRLQEVVCVRPPPTHPFRSRAKEGRCVTARCVTACGGVGRSCCSSSSRLGVGVGQHLVGCLLAPRAFAPGEPRASPGGVARAPGAPWPGARRTAAPPPPAPAPGAPSEASGDPCRVTSSSSPPAAGDPAGRRLPGAGLPAHPGGPGLPEPPGTPLCQRWGHPLFPRSRARRGTAGRFGVAWRGADDDDGAGGKLWLQG